MLLHWSEDSNGCRKGGKMKTTEKSTEAKSLPKSVADLVNDKPALVTERPAVSNSLFDQGACI